ncbi:hypothetical protein LWI29_004472 [Acer saccharum]|uniref:RNase H type-1 domain-containing protein n=1 Tax=Acer saccharum TaxID=4024 RepID=A0AA39RGB1_ACESA|nr:hypothetical protein LWI29_004472 [Acer saccharum]
MRWFGGVEIMLRNFAKLGLPRVRGVAMDGRSKEERNVRWNPPDHGLVKVNCNVRVYRKRRRVGYGIIVRDDGGRVLWCSAQGCEANYDLNCAKALAIYKGLLVGCNLGLANFVVETNSKMVVKQIWNGDNLEVCHGGILDAIQNIMTDGRSIVFNTVSAKANKVALALANEALSITNLVTWKEDAPICIKAMVNDEQRT